MQRGSRGRQPWNAGRVGREASEVSCTGRRSALVSFEGDLRKIMKRAEEQGWRVEKRKEYWYFWPPDGTTPPAKIGGTPNTKGRGLKNFLAELRRKGYRG